MPLIGSGLIQSADTWPQASDWLVKDEYTDPVAAGSVNGTAAQPGPGTRAVTDTGSKLSVGSGSAVIAASGASWGDPNLYYGSVARAAGLAIIATVTPAHEYCEFGFDTNVSGNLPSFLSWQFRNSNDYSVSGGPAIGKWVAGTAQNLRIILRSAGALFMEGTTLRWVDNSTTSTPLYPMAYSNLGSGSGSVQTFRVIALPAPFDTDTGLCTDTHSGAVSAGTTFTHESDVWMEFIATTVPSGDSIDVQFRKADSLNYWICRISSSGDISLEEVVDGSETQRGLAAGVVSNGHRVVIIADDESIRVLSNNTSRISYGSAASAKTATAGEVDALGTGGAVSNVYTWPRTLGATAATTQAASILNKVSA